jgi:uncharacterized membrane protein YphA (DoxX/SURF4 family)
VNGWSKAFLIALRIAVGWHFLYEGLWKIDSDTGATSYATSWYTLQSSVGRLRDYFERSPAGEVKLEPALARADAWHDEIVKAFKARNKALAEDQKARLAELRDKVKLAAAEAARGEIRGDQTINFDWTFVRDEVLKIAAEQEGERFTALPYLQASAGPFRPLFRALVHDIDGVERLTVASAQAGLDERYRQVLRHYASAGKPFTAGQQARLAQARDALKISIAATLNDPGFRARLADYQLMRNRAAADPSRVSAPFTRERLAEDRGKLDGIAGELLGFVNEPLAELAVQAQTLATVDQLGAGPLPRPGDPSGWIDRTIQWGLAAIGVCLLLGLFTPVAAVAAAAQLAMFYFASPPWPGLPAATLGGHYLYVDRNLIEMIAALVIATTGTGRWAGLDAYLYRYAAARLRRSPATPQPSYAAARPRRQTPVAIEVAPQISRRTS